MYACKIVLISKKYLAYSHLVKILDSHLSAFIGGHLKLSMPHNEQWRCNTRGKRHLLSWHVCRGARSSAAMCERYIGWECKYRSNALDKKRTPHGIRDIKPPPIRDINKDTHKGMYIKSQWNFIFMNEVEICIHTLLILIYNSPRNLTVFCKLVLTKCFV